jgi:hypothetical protein
MNFPVCNSKLRKFKEGVICFKNHKFLEGTKIYDTNTYMDEKLLCSVCGKKGESYCMCGDCGIKCINGHIWNPNI